MTVTRTLLVALGLTAGLAAQAPSVAISIGLRETGAGGVPFTQIGDNGGSAGGIEWVNLDGQSLVLDGTWQQFTFDLANDPITTFAGSTANGTLEGGYGTLEHVRILNTGGVTDEINFYIDDISNTITPAGGSPQTTTFGTFDTYMQGDEVMFHESTFSGSTSGNVVAGPVSSVDNFVASRTESYRMDVQFVDSTPTRWVRLTTFNNPNQPNPFVRFDQGATISFWMRGGVAQENLGSQGPGNAISEVYGEGLANGETSTYYLTGVAPGIVGAFSISLPGGMDVAVLGGNLVSFSNNLIAIGVAADSMGNFQLPIPGTATPTTLIVQSVFFDPTTTSNLTFSNAVQVEQGL